VDLHTLVVQPVHVVLLGLELHPCLLLHYVHGQQHGHTLHLGQHYVVLVIHILGFILVLTGLSFTEVTLCPVPRYCHTGGLAGGAGVHLQAVVVVLHRPAGVSLQLYILLSTYKYIFWGQVIRIIEILIVLLSST
jgi:hypothetical protein